MSFHRACTSDRYPVSIIAAEQKPLSRFFRTEGKHTADATLRQTYRPNSLFLKGNTLGNDLETENQAEHPPIWLEVLERF